MKLEAGKCYVMRNGGVTGKMEYKGGSGPYQFSDEGISWTIYGKLYEYSDSSYDIVAEYQEPQTTQEESTMDTEQSKPNKPHKHAEVIKAWADGAEIEWRHPSDGQPWELAGNPHWFPELEYRVKPQIVTSPLHIYTSPIFSDENDHLGPDLRITLTKDSTGKILSLTWDQLR